MKMRSRSRRSQWLRWFVAACVCTAAYVVVERFLGSDKADVWYDSKNLVFLASCVILFGVIAYMTRWDGIVHRPKGVRAGAHPHDPPTQPGGETPHEAAVDSKADDDGGAETTPDPSLAEWERIRSMPHNYIPNPVADAEFLRLVHEAAEAGCAPALAKLGEFAWRRGAIVEAHFWTSLAARRGLKSVWHTLHDLRREWVAQGCPPQYEFVYEAFPQERASVARALMRVSCGIDVAMSRQRIRDLAAKGNPDAALLMATAGQ